jgi:hypothetical protein
VLLEDFSADQQFMKQTLNIGRTQEGMSGVDMPQIQLFFCDACSGTPNEYKEFENAGKGLSFRRESGVEDLRAAPIYHASCPGTVAMGHRGSGTYFAEALIDCLNGAAMDGIDLTAGPSIAGRYFHVKISRLLEALQSRTSQIAARDGQKQSVRLGGTLRSGIFSASPEPPQLETEVYVDPDVAARASEAQLWDWNESAAITKRTKCWERPAALGRVPCGIYQLKVYGSAPYRPEHTYIFIATTPPIARYEIKL